MAEQKLHRGGAPYIAGRYRYASAHDMYALLGVKQLPAEGMPERVIQGVRVYVKPLAGGPRLQRHGKRSAHRVMAICGCGRHVPVGRLHQHKCKQVCCTSMERDGTCRDHLGMRFGRTVTRG